MSLAYEPLATAPNSSGSIYSSGYVSGNNANIAQNNLNNSTKGGKRRKKRIRSSRRRSRSRNLIRNLIRNLRGGVQSITPIPVAYSDGGGINNNYAELTALNNQSAANSVGDAAVTKGGRRSRKSQRSHKRRQSRKRRSRRHK
jgi:hypothetical protein